MNWWLTGAIALVPAAFLAGRYSSRYQFVRIRRRYKQNVNEFIRGR